jgi:hypothetical protein
MKLEELLMQTIPMPQGGVVRTQHIEEFASFPLTRERLNWKTV